MLKAFFCLLCQLFMVNAVQSKALESYLTGLIEKSHFVGFVLLIDAPHQPLFEKAYGYANLEKKIKARKGDVYRIASSTKPFIAATVIRLAMQKKLHLDAPLKDYLSPKTLEGLSNANEVTIRQLLAMQSGIYNYTDNPLYETFVDQHPQHHWTALDALRFARGKPAEFKPGTATEYSNSNYILLGLLIEKLSKKTLAQALKQEIFDPLNLDQTALETDKSQIALVTPGYGYSKGVFKNFSQVDGGRGLADGGILSTARDMNQFIRHVLTDDHFMPPYWRQQMLDVHPMKGNERLKYGLGLMEFSYQGIRFIGHDGSDSGYQSLMLYAPEQQTSLVFLSNSNPPSLDQSALMEACFSGNK